MGKALFAAVALALILAVSSVSALDYHYYVLGHGDVTYGYTSSEASTYDKTTSNVDTPWGSQTHTTIKKSSTESFQPNYPYYPDFMINNNGFNQNYYNNGYYDSCYYTYDGCWQNNHDVLTVRYYDPYENPNTIYPTNWRYKDVYYPENYPNQNDYGYSYYYQPAYDWFAQIYNWNW